MAAGNNNKVKTKPLLTAFKSGTILFSNSAYSVVVKRSDTPKVNTKSSGSSEIQIKTDY
jgi:hypothetical protein